MRYRSSVRLNMNHTLHPKQGYKFRIKICTVTVTNLVVNYGTNRSLQFSLNGEEKVTVHV